MTEEAIADFSVRIIEYLPRWVQATGIMSFSLPGPSLPACNTPFELIKSKSCCSQIIDFLKASLKSIIDLYLRQKHFSALKFS